MSAYSTLETYWLFTINLSWLVVLLFCVFLCFFLFVYYREKNNNIIIIDWSAVLYCFVLFFSCRQQVAHQNGLDASTHRLTFTSCACHMFNSGKQFNECFILNTTKWENVVLLTCSQAFISPKSLIIVCVACLLKSCKHLQGRRSISKIQWTSTFSAPFNL